MKWLIIFPDSWISYSPSILNFLKMLELYEQEYLIVYLNTDEFDNSKINLNDIKIEINSSIVKFLKKIRLYRFYIYLKFIYRIKKNVEINEFDKIVGIDSIGYSIAKIFSINPIYYSLEVSKNWLNKIIFNFLKPSLLIVQTKERKDYLAKNFNSVVYIQNSPISKKHIQGLRKYRGKLVYFGNIIESHGIEICLSALYKLKNETLMIKGTGNDTYVDYLRNKYKDLFFEGRVHIDTNYINQDDIYSFLKDFDMGFCFYDMNIIGSKNFNYLSSPSGKIFNYLMCAIPVIGSKIIGLDVIEKNKAGILLSEIKVDNIVKAIKDIELNYQMFTENAYKVSYDFDYAKMFASNWDKLSNI
ncbi:hypothetical protein QTA56_09725 [Acinetobacter sp. VNH17]|uniref:Glycosyltransferase n=1 Tax=Acinetobacter thutiue TaxID=2998078 RepID=A0ABT7WPB3_9GAMM|nr:hypothetical protein [Acinetobacter thutiue]MCY6412409.1 hypothetical protein [Acinetobacter thutiue]MDN0014514.1 hypothetical protein [Acinetobacter thutiue]